MSAPEASRDPSLPAIGDVVDGKYRLEAALGRGGMATVFAARHTISQRRVALKWLDPSLNGSRDARARFLRESEAMGRIEHPNVVTVLDVGSSAEGSYLVMELLRGESLRLFLERVKRLSARDAVELLLPVISGVEAAHRVEVIHRDLKPDNLFVTRAEAPDRPAVRILDFGVAKLDGRGGRTPAARTTPTPMQTGAQQLGTPRYMAPEQVLGAKTDERTDVWGLGSILYELITGRAPFDVPGEARLFVAIATDAPRPIEELAPDVPPALAKVVMRALAKDPNDRPPTAKAFGHALARSMGMHFREPRATSSPRLEAVAAPIETSAPTSPGKRPTPVGLVASAMAEAVPRTERRDATTVDRRPRRADERTATELVVAPRDRMKIALLYAALVFLVLLVLTGAALAAVGT